jgi:hypothetical protein
MLRRLKKILITAVGLTVAGVVFCAFYIRAHPMVFNESCFMHAHCIVITGLAFDSYAAEHGGRYPMDTNGYGNALLQLTNYMGDFWAGYTGPGYDGKVFADAARTGHHVPEAECGRVYVQGLAQADNPDIALFFDKMPSPGGDHCHFPFRLYAPLAREVWTIGSGHRVIRESDWNAFATNQVQLLVAAGIPREQAEAYYSERSKPPMK